MLDGTDLDNVSASSAHHLQQQQREVPLASSETIKYNIYGEYTNDENTQIRMEVIFEGRQNDNLTIIGALLNENTAIDGKCYDQRGPKDGWDIELYKGLTPRGE